MRNRSSRPLKSSSGCRWRLMRIRGLPELNIAAIKEKAGKVDCLHPQAHACWHLLECCVQNSFQAMAGTTPEKVEAGIKAWSALDGSLVTPEFLDVKRTFEDAISDWIAAHPEDAPDVKQKAAAGLTNPTFDKAVSQPYSSTLARIQGLTHVIAQETATEVEKHVGDQAAISKAITDLLDQMEISLRNPQNKPKLPPKGEGDLSVRHLFSYLGNQPKEPALQRQSKATPKYSRSSTWPWAWGTSSCTRRPWGS